MAAKGIQSPRRWDCGMISTNLEGIWGMSGRYTMLRTPGRAKNIRVVFTGLTVSLLMLLADFLCFVGAASLAERLYRLYLGIFKGWRTLLLPGLGSILERSGQLDKAIECYQQTLRIDPQNAGCYFWLGLVYENKQEISSAICNYRKALELGQFGNEFQQELENKVKFLSTKVENEK